MEHKTIGCRYFIGEKPCRFHPDCAAEACMDYKTFGPRILIIKLDAMGDVLRTTPVLPEIKKLYPECHVTWVVSFESREILERNPYIDRLVSAEPDELFCLLEEEFDVVYSLDKGPLAIALANKVKAGKRIGFCMNRYGALGYFNDESGYAFRLGFNNTLKFRENQKTYQQIIFEMCGFSGPYGEYIYEQDPAAEKEAERLFAAWGIKPGERVVGINTGAGKVFATKKWPASSFIELAKLLSGTKRTKVLLLGGPQEKELNAMIAKKLGKAAVNAGTENPVSLFCGIVARCGVLVTADTLAMHLAIARKRKVVALFGATSAVEVDLYGRGIKLSKDVSCAPCYRSSCDDLRCMKEIFPRDVYDACESLLKQNEGGA